MKRLPLLLLGLAALLCPGCGIFGFVAYLFAPEAGKKTIEPEYKDAKDMPGKSLAVLVYIDDNTNYEFDKARWELSMALKDELEKNIKGLKVIDPAKVIEYQEANLDWQGMPMTKLGKTFNVDYVLYVGVSEFQTKDPLSDDINHGRIAAEASLTKCSLADEKSCVWRGSGLGAEYEPKDPSAIATESDDTIAHKTEGMFADLLAKKFYKYELEPPKYDEPEASK